MRAVVLRSLSLKIRSSMGRNAFIEIAPELRNIFYIELVQADDLHVLFFDQSLYISIHITAVGYYSVKPIKPILPVSDLLLRAQPMLDKDKFSARLQYAPYLGQRLADI